MKSNYRNFLNQNTERNAMQFSQSIKGQIHELLQSFFLASIFIGVLTFSTPALSTSPSSTPAAAEISQILAKPMEKITPVMVVCLAENQETFLKIDSRFPFLAEMRRISGLLQLITGNSKDTEKINALFNKEYPPVGGWHYLPIGSGFVVDSDRQYVVTNWHVTQFCPRNVGLKMQIGIIESSGFDLEPIPALHIGERTVKDEKGHDISEHIYVRALCKNRKSGCSIESQKNVELYAPDLAVIKLNRPARTAPIPLASSPMLDPSANLMIAGYPQVMMHLSQGSGSPRTQSTMPTLAPARFSNLQPFNNFDLGIDQKDVIETKFMMLAAQIHPGNSGGPLLFNNQVVGVVTATVAHDSAKAVSIQESGVEEVAQGGIIIPTGYGLAVPVSEVLRMLTWLGIKPVGLAPLVISPTLKRQPEDIPPVMHPLLESSNNKIIIALLACILVAGAAFFVMARDHAKAKKTFPSKPLGTLNSANPTAGVKEPTVEQTNNLAKKPATSKETYTAAVQLKASHGVMNGKIFAIPTPNGGMALVVGRNPLTCQIVFPNETDLVGRQHCSFVWNPNNRSFVVEDMDSSNGTFINGRKLNKGERAALKDGDTVDIGAASMNRFSVNIL